MTTQHESFGAHVQRCNQRGEIVLQPRMGFGDPDQMREGLLAVRALPFATVGTITLDSYTRVGDAETPRAVLAHGGHLNGYPILTHDISTTVSLIQATAEHSFPLQVRHGTSQPQRIFRRMVQLGLSATEGGPVSYCLPYGRTRLRDAITAWAEGCLILADSETQAHIESFGGCMLGQLCPPSLLIAITILEGLFFTRYGIRSLSLSYAQGTSDAQDIGAIRALGKAAATYLGGADWHIVFYMYMGVFPTTNHGANALIRDAARVAAGAGCSRIIVKTPAEALQIPDINDNINAMRLTREAIEGFQLPDSIEVEAREHADLCYAESAAILDAVLSLSEDVGQCIERAFQSGLLDVPYCIHQDNRGITRSYLDSRGALQWAKRGRIPGVNAISPADRTLRSVSAEDLLRMLQHKAHQYDRTATTAPS